MSIDRSIPLTIVASRRELPPQTRIWGTGGWVSPQEREALDWLTLGILMGWDPVVLYDQDPLPQKLLAASRIIVLAVDPGELPAEAVTLVKAVLAESSAVVFARAAGPQTEWAGLAGACRSDSGPGLVGRAVSVRTESAESWCFPKGFTATRLVVSADIETVAESAGAALLVRKRVGAGQVFTMGLHPSELRDAGGAGTAFLRHLLITSSPAPVDWLDLSGTVILRMDDPGGSQNVHSRSWCYPKLTGQQWDEIAGELRARSARLTIGYVSGWVDDGDPERDGSGWAGRRFRANRGLSTERAWSATRT